jgi:prepilin-type N-terminal cleavage/methylation domain-containing protein
MKPQSSPLRARARSRGFTLSEILISLTLVVSVLAMALSTFLFGLRTMYKDTQRLATNASLRYFMNQVSMKTLDASEFYIFPLYSSLDGNVSLTSDVTSAQSDSYGTDIYHGDCLVLVTRTSLAVDAKVKQFRIYYRLVADSNDEGILRYYESPDYGSAGSSSSLTALLNAVNLSTTPAYSATGRNQILAARTRGRPKPGTGHYPIFSSEYPTITPTNEYVSINVEIINGNAQTNLLSSSSFNYTISPRR